MTGREPQPQADTAKGQHGGFSNDDDNIRQQQVVDIADENQQPPLPDPGGERHAAIKIDDDAEEPSDKAI